MLLTKGVIRVGMPIPQRAEFELAAVDDPYRLASPKELSLFRRPLPSTNLDFIATVMRDGRESADGLAIPDALNNQAIGATTGHAEGAHLSDKHRDEIVTFERSLYTAQTWDYRAGSLLRGGVIVELYDRRFKIGLSEAEKRDLEAFLASL